MKILLLISEHSKIKQAIEKIEELVHYRHEVLAICTRPIAESLGRELGRRRLNKYIQLIVFKDNYPEENALKIITLINPDLVIDFDSMDKFSYLKLLIKAKGTVINHH